MARVHADLDRASDDGDWEDWVSEDESSSAFFSLLTAATHSAAAAPTAPAAAHAPTAAGAALKPVHASLAAVWDELRQHTGFDMAAFQAAHGKDPYATVRIINYLRHVANSAAAAGGNVVAAVTSATAPAALSAAMASWTDETWLRPELEDDAVLMAALEAVDLDDEETEAEAEAEGSAVAAVGAAATASRPSADASAVPANLEQAKAMIAELQRQLGVANRMLHACTAGDASDSDDTAAGSDSDTDSDADASRANRAAHAARRAQAAVKGVAAPAGAAPSDVPAQDNDTYYFDSYAGVDIHCDMLSDAVRTDAYRDALKRNPHRYAGKQVLDVGCGTGILSMFAAQAGAAHVIALDASAIIEEATVIVAANGLSDRVRPVRGKAEEVDLPRYLPAAADGKVDIIVSEWMGYALLYECMLNSVLEMRDKYLRKGGFMQPSSATICLAGMTDEPRWHARVAFWKDVYGFNMKNMVRHALAEPGVTVVPPEVITTSTSIIKHFDTATMHASEQDILAAPFKLTPHNNAADATLHGLNLWFDIGFDFNSPFPGADNIVPPAAVVPAGTLATPAASAATAGAAAAAVVVDGDDDDMPPLETDAAPTGSSAPHTSSGTAAAAAAPDARDVSVSFSTGAHTTPTHWAQTQFLFEQPVVVPAGATLEGTLTMTRDASNPREYRFEVVVSSPPAAAFRRQYHMR